MNKKMLLLTVMVVIVSNVFAGQLDYGNKPLAIGSAYTAIQGDFYSLYSNPAGIYSGKTFDFKLDLLASANFTGDILGNINGIISSAEKFDKIRQQQEQGGTIDVTQIYAFFNAIKNLADINKPGKGMLLQFNGGVGCKIKNFAFGVRNITNFGADPFIDTVNFGLGGTTSNPVIPKSLMFTNGGTEGIVITTDTLKYPELTQQREELENVIGWLVETAEKLGVEIPPEIKQDIENNKEGIANALINLAKDNGVSDEEIKTAVKQLNDPEFQQMITDIVTNMISSQGSFKTNQSALVFKGINFSEVTVGYSHKIIKNLFIGASLKYIIARTLYYNLKVFEQKEEINDMFVKEKILPQIEKTYQAVDIDIGVIYRLPTPIVETNVGLVIKNLLSPQFSLEATTEKLSFPRQVKLGVAGTLWKRITLSFDYDLNSVPTVVEGYNIQNLAVGLEINPPYLPYLRLGYIKNLAYNNDYLYTLGLGIKIFVLNFDLVGAIRPENIKITEETTIPASNLSLGLTLGVKF